MADAGELLKTPLFDLHTARGAKMLGFAGYALPAHYPAGIIAEHRQVREAAGLFDVSHMGQITVRGAPAGAGLEKLLPIDVLGLQPGRQRYGFFTNSAGGILDDLMVTHAGDHYYLVVNAAGKQADLEHLQAGLPDCEVRLLAERALLALQGPLAAAVLARHCPAAAELAFMQSAELQVAEFACRVWRCGYSGEDGFELSVAGAQAEALARLLLEAPEVAPAGLGARDTLRLEAGLCLYGQDIDTGTTPVEADLAWAISRVRRAGGARAGGFAGSETVLQQLRDGPARRRVGIQPLGRAPVRAGAGLFEPGGATPLGRVTSGGFGPSVERPVAMGYLAAEHAVPGTRLQAQVRGKRLDVEVAALPFVAHRYHRG